MSSPSTTEPATGAPADERDEAREARLEMLRAELGDAVVGSHIRPGRHLWVRVTRDAWVSAAEVARGRLNCRFFDFLSGIDWLPSPFGRELEAEVDVELGGREPREPVPMTSGYAGGGTRFQVFANVVDVVGGLGLTLKADLPDDDLSVGTWSHLYLGANWHERETAEMFGFTFVGHPLPLNLYLPSGFEGHPLRKDFPLLARRVKPWPGIVDVEPMPGESGTAPEGGA